jgi:hypothetical protein
MPPKLLVLRGDESLNEVFRDIFVTNQPQAFTVAFAEEFRDRFASVIQEQRSKTGTIVVDDFDPGELVDVVLEKWPAVADDKKNDRGESEKTPGVKERKETPDQPWIGFGFKEVGLILLAVGFGPIL